MICAAYNMVCWKIQKQVRLFEAQGVCENTDLPLNIAEKVVAYAFVMLILKTHKLFICLLSSPKMRRKISANPNEMP